MDEVDSNIQIVMRQTDYTYEEAKNHLEINNNNITEVIRLYLKPNICSLPSESKQLSMNQQIYKEIRTLMDQIEVGKQK
jgi:hypothetical protein